MLCRDKLSRYLSEDSMQRQLQNVSLPKGPTNHIASGKI